MGNIYRPNTDYTLSTQVVGDNGKVAFIPKMTPTDTAGVPLPTGASATTAMFAKLVNNGNIGGGNATYAVTGTAYGAYATPTDTLTITGSASKIIIVTDFWMAAGATAATLMTFFYTKRSTANTGGTATNPAGIPHDSTNAAATAVVNLYTAAPTPGTSLGDVHLVTSSASALTNVPSLFSLFLGNGLDAPRQMTDLRQPVTLRGVNESLSMNLKGVALPTGFTANYGLRWVEV